MPIKINSTGGGSVSIDVPSTGGTYTLTAPANNAAIFTTDGGAITGNVAFTSNNVTIGGSAISSATGMRNRIINGDMRIDQRYAGSSVIIGNAGICVDRWRLYLTTGVYSAQRVSDGPSGFSNSLKLTVTTPQASLGSGDYYSLLQLIEGYNVSDLDWGTSNAKTVSVSFWVKSSITGTFSYTLQSSVSDVSFVKTYTISSANTWQQVTATIPGPTTGTFYTDNSNGLILMFGLGNGSTYSTSTLNSWVAGNVFGATGQTNFISTNGATIQFTGVQLEVGSVFTPFERRMYGHELALCQRYYSKNAGPEVAVPNNGSSYSTAAFSSGSFGTFATNTAYLPWFSYPVAMRTAPTLTFINTNLATSPTSGVWTYYNTGGWASMTTMAIQSCNTIGFGAYCTGTFALGWGSSLWYGAWTANAEL